MQLLYYYNVDLKQKVVSYCKLRATIKEHNYKDFGDKKPVFKSVVRPG